MSFPELILAGMVVAAGIYMLEQFDATAAWLLTFLLLIIIAMRYQAFATELGKLLSNSSAAPNQDPNFDPTVPLPNIPLG
jgi:hypothetical protein